MVRNFFFYGTLRLDLAQGLPARLVSKLRLVGPATARGKIFARLDPHGAYPVLFRGGRGLVHGVVCRAEGGFSGRSLSALDRYEGAAGTGGEYFRRSLRVVQDDGSALMADAYIYSRRSSRTLVPIPHGDFARWLSETGVEPYCG